MSGMNGRRQFMWHRKFMWRKAVLVATIVMLTALGVTAVALADLRITTESETVIPGMPTLPGMDFGDGDEQQIFMKNNRIVLLDEEGTRFVVDCAAGEFAMVADSHNAYWQGTVAAFVDELGAAFDMMGGAGDGEANWAEEMFGSGRDAYAVGVRTVRVGEEKVAGYDAVHYRVEYEQDGEWHLFDNVWLSPSLLRQVEIEVGSCLNTVFVEMQQLLVAMAIGEGNEMWSVMTSPEYMALAAEGYPVRNEQVIETFGMRVETTTEVVDVSADTLAEELFAIPDHYERISLLEAMMPPQ